MSDKELVGRMMTVERVKELNSKDWFYKILKENPALTGIKPGETDQDLKFSLETVNCVGCCALGPVMVVDGEYHGNMAPAKSEDVLKKYE